MYTVDSYVKDRFYRLIIYIYNVSIIITCIQTIWLFRNLHNIIYIYNFLPCYYCEEIQFYLNCYKASNTILISRYTHVSLCFYQFKHTVTWYIHIRYHLYSFSDEVINNAYKYSLVKDIYDRNSLN